MIVKLLTKHHLEFLSLKEAAEARPSLHLLKCQIVGNLMPRLNYNTLSWAVAYLVVRHLQLLQGKKINEYDQAMPQSHTAYQPTAP